jgi:hypothetical protein
MASVDLKNNIKSLNALNIQAITTNTTTVGVEIDTQGFESATFEIIVGARTDGTVTPLIQESDVSGSYAGSVADDDLIGTEAQAALSAAQSRSIIGYVGKKRYVKLSLVSTLISSSGLTAGASAILGSARHNPVA